jgi:pSer/pThr/pTyr-binding forkhead associated (FHA) protein
MPKIILKLGQKELGNFVFDSDKKIITIGRGKESDIVLKNLSISRNHAEIRKVQDSYVIYDLKSTNGVFMRDKPVTTMVLSNKDEICIGKHILVFYEDKAEEGRDINDTTIKISS